MKSVPDFGIEIITPNAYGHVDTASESWSGMPHEMRQLLLKSEHWEPVDPKPDMLILAEAASDWLIHETDDDSEPEEGDYNV